MTQATLQELLNRLARQTLNRAGAVKNSVVYQVSQGWERDILLKDSNVVVVNNAMDMEDAVQNASIHALFVPKNASLTQEIAERVLLRNPLSKTIFWEC